MAGHTYSAFSESNHSLTRRIPGESLGFAHRAKEKFFRRRQRSRLRIPGAQAVQQDQTRRQPQLPPQRRLLLPHLRHAARAAQAQLVKAQAGLRNQTRFGTHIGPLHWGALHDFHAAEANAATPWSPAHLVRCPGRPPPAQWVRKSAVHWLQKCTKYPANGENGFRSKEVGTLSSLKRNRDTTEPEEM